MIYKLQYIFGIMIIIFVKMKIKKYGNKVLQM